MRASCFRQFMELRENGTVAERWRLEGERAGVGSLSRTPVISISADDRFVSVFLLAARVEEAFVLDASDGRVLLDISEATALRTERQVRENVPGPPVTVVEPLPKSQRFSPRFS